MLNEQDLDLLLAPIPGESPAGTSLEFEGTYDVIREARREDDPNLPQGIWEVAPKRAEWGRVRDLCVEALSRRSKDFQIAMWLLEASMALDGFAGVRYGLDLLRRLSEDFWDDMFPAIEGGDIEYRLLPFEWMNDKLSLRLKSIPITAPTGEEKSVYTWADLEAARRLENLAVKDQKILKDAEREGAVTMALFDGSMMLTPDAVVGKLYEDLEGSSGALDELRNVLRDKCGDQAPSLARFSDVLAGIRATIGATLRQRGIEADDADGAPDEAGPEIVDEAEEERPAVRPTAPERSGEFRSRSEAYATLAAIAEYLMKIEPHSPTPYLLKRAVAWGSMPLPTLLHELMAGKDDLQKIYALLGLGEK